MNYRSIPAIYNRAKKDTEFKPFRIIISGALIGLACWLYLPIHQFPNTFARITIGVLIGVVVFPAIEFIWNYFRAPLKLADERITELQAHISLYKATKNEQEINLGDGHVLKGRWYGKRFVFDESCEDFSVLLPLESMRNPISIRVSCRPGSLGHFSFVVNGSASLYVRTPGGVNGKILKGSGELEMPLNENAQLEFEYIKGNGTLRWFTLGWTES